MEIGFSIKRTKFLLSDSNAPKRKTNFEKVANGNFNPIALIMRKFYKGFAIA